MSLVYICVYVEACDALFRVVLAREVLISHPKRVDISIGLARDHLPLLDSNRHHMLYRAQVTQSSSSAYQAPSSVGHSEGDQRVYNLR